LFELEVVFDSDLEVGFDSDLGKEYKIGLE
jgi:hypothetical protein